MRLHQLKAPKGANVKRTRRGRGESSGLGKTAGLGGKGQTARTGKGKRGRGFEGGQTPMYRRMPKRGFTNIHAKQYAEVNLDSLAERFPAGAHVDLIALRALGLARNTDVGVRVLGRGDIKHALTITADHFTGSAKQKIEAAGGKTVAIEKKTSKEESKQASA
jgi:large subunit ribosomal protein L15